IDMRAAIDNAQLVGLQDVPVAIETIELLDERQKFRVLGDDQAAVADAIGNADGLEIIGRKIYPWAIGDSFKRVAEIDLAGGRIHDHRSHIGDLAELGGGKRQAFEPDQNLRTIGNSIGAKMRRLDRIDRLRQRAAVEPERERFGIERSSLPDHFAIECNLRQCPCVGRVGWHPETDTESCQPILDPGARNYLSTYSYLA